MDWMEDRLVAAINELIRLGLAEETLQPNEAGVMEPAWYLTPLAQMVEECKNGMGLTFWQAYETVTGLDLDAMN